MVRTERESDMRRIKKKWHTCWCCRDLQRACRIAQASEEKLEHTGPAEKKRVASVPQREQLVSTPESSKYRWQVRQSWQVHQSTAASTWWCGFQLRLGWVKMAVGLPEDPSYPGNSPSSLTYRF